jgi:uncharacterized membrane protein
MDIDIENSNKNNHKKTANLLIRIGRIITFIAAVFLLVMLISEGSISGNATQDLSEILLVVFALIALAGYALSLWKVKYAGILLVAVSVAFGIDIGYYLNTDQLAAWAMMGLPHLIAGGLLLLGWQMKRRAQA